MTVPRNYSLIVGLLSDWQNPNEIETWNILQDPAKYLVWDTAGPNTRTHLRSGTGSFHAWRPGRIFYLEKMIGGILIILALAAVYYPIILN